MPEVAHLVFYSRLIVMKRLWDINRTGRRWDYIMDFLSFKVIPIISLYKLIDTQVYCYVIWDFMYKVFALVQVSI